MHPHHFLHFFAQFPPQLATLLIAMLPFVERFALPFAVVRLHLPVWEAFILSVLGNLVPVVLTLVVGENFHVWLAKDQGMAGKYWRKSVTQAQEKFVKYEKWGLWGLCLFAFVPSPVTGAFAASLVSFILGYPMKKSFPFIAAGVVAYNIALMLATLGVVRIF